MFTFLYCPGLAATNNAAERALRPLVVARKNWGGNRTDNGARQAVLSSVLATAPQQGKNPLDVLIDLLMSPDKSKILDLVPFCRDRASPSSTRPQTPISHTGRAASQAEGALSDEWVMLAALSGSSVSLAVRA